jgi:hypothetical protein
LESEGKEDWQIRQAYKAIKVFLEDFMCLLIDFTEDSKNGSTCKPVKKPKTWKEGFSKFINEIRFQHLAYNTEKTYRSWIRRFIEFCNNASPEEIESSHVKKLVLPIFAYQALPQDVAMIISFNIFFRKEIGLCRQVYCIMRSESGDISTRIPNMKEAVFISI